MHVLHLAEKRSRYAQPSVALLDEVDWSIIYSAYRENDSLEY